MISMDTLIDRMLFMAIGCIMGLALGWISRTMKYARDARNDAHLTREEVAKVMGELKDEQGSFNLQSLSLLLVVILVASSAFISGLAASRVGSTQDNLLSSQKCSETVLKNVIQTLNERTSYSSDINIADRKQNVAFQKIAEATLRKVPPTPEESRRLVEDYKDKLSDYLRHLERAQKTRASTSYPEIDDYRECLNNSKD